MSGTNQGRAAWTTHDELVFIAHLLEKKKAKERKSLLEGYLAGFGRRVNWGDIDRAAVREALFAALKAA